MRVKYPRTPHLPWSPGATNDDIHQGNLSNFEGKIVVVRNDVDKIWAELEKVRTAPKYMISLAESY